MARLQLGGRRGPAQGRHRPGSGSAIFIRLHERRIGGDLRGHDHWAEQTSAARSARYWCRPKPQGSRGESALFLRIGGGPRPCGHVGASARHGGRGQERLAPRSCTWSCQVLAGHRSRLLAHGACSITLPTMGTYRATWWRRSTNGCTTTCRSSPGWKRSIRVQPGCRSCCRNGLARPAIS